MVWQKPLISPPTTTQHPNRPSGPAKAPIFRTTFHEGDPTGGESTESCDENDNMTDCRHVRQAVDLQKVKKALIKTGLTTECEQCKKMPKVASEMEPDSSSITRYGCVCGAG
ncbi:hypothetical protein TcasGA2_TC034983, partial [Tribolium castaneum]